MNQGAEKYNLRPENYLVWLLFLKLCPATGTPAQIK